MSFYIKAQEIFTEQEIVRDQYLKISDGRIAAIGEVPGNSDEVLDLGDCRVVPGFIDLHIHGSGGCDVMDGTHEALNTISKTIAANGVVGFLGTTVTDTWERNLAALKNVRDVMKKGVDGAQLLGSYSEAIFFTNDFKGAHEGSYFRKPTREKLDEMLAAADGSLKALALAPELDGALDAIRYLTSKGVRVTVGHTGATYEQCKLAFEAGAVGGVHIFNQMLGLHHREPGTVGAVLHHQDIYAELIADGVHVNPVVLDLVYRLKGTKKTALITDCMCAGGLSDGEYQLGLLKVTVKDGVARTESGSLAGSTLSLNRAVANMIEMVNVDPLNAVHMASLTPATILGLQDELGSIREGKRASLTVLDKNHEVVMTFIDGHQIFTKH
ncbi:MAG: N-acetylglucosamine-6-phosphate deacetylase [Endozoicomonas sp.]